MNNEILDKIVNCSISLDSPVSSGADFGTILIVGNRPATEKDKLKAVDKYSSLAEIKEAGWEEEEEVYKAAKAAFLQEPKPRYLYIAVPEKSENKVPAETVPQPEDETQAAAATPVEDGTEETILQVVEKVLGMEGWYGLALAGAEESDFAKVAEKIEVTEKIFAYSTNEETNPVEKKEYMRTFGIYSEDKYIHVAWMAKSFAFSPGSETWGFKTLAGMQPSELSTRKIAQLGDEKLNYYVTCAGKNITLDGKMLGGEWIDIIRFRDWLKNQMQTEIYKLFIKNPKVPFTDSGIVLVENQMEAVLANGQETGGIAETEYDENDEPVPGYTVTVPRAAELTSEQRARRVLPGCKFTARLSGAIHAVELRGNLTF